MPHFVYTILKRLERKCEKRLERYKAKAAKAKGTDVVNQGAKIKATVECLQDVQVELSKLDDTET